MNRASMAVACLLMCSIALPIRADEKVNGVPALAQTAPDAIRLPVVTGLLTIEHRPDGATHLAIVMHGPDGKALTRFDDDMTKAMHVIAIDDGFVNFTHAHVDRVSPDGTAETTLRLPMAALYHIYVDCQPYGLGRQVLRFDVQSAHSKAAPVTLPPASLTASTGPYEVKLDTDRLRVGIESMIGIAILKDGKPASDLGSYLGVPAHVVIIDTSTLHYIHAHPMEMGDDHQKSDDRLMLHTELPRAGKYRAWVQFMGGGTLHTTAFTLTAE